MNPLFDKLLPGLNPYENVSLGEASELVDQPTLRDAILKSRPGIIIEVGSFLGQSAISMCRLAVEAGLDATVICVDTWLGGIDHWLNEWPLLHHVSGRPDLYDRFLRNVLAAGCSDRILPITLDSANAARYLSHHGIEANMIYIDGSHELGDVLRDLRDYWKLLSSGGIMVVDDAVEHFPGVVHDVEAFAKETGLVTTCTDGWKRSIQK